MEGISIAQSISELGILVVIAGIFLWIVIKKDKKQDEFNEKMFNMILEQMKTRSFNHVLTPEEDQVAISIDKALNSYLQTAVIDLEASRAFIARYHNGGKDMNSISFLKVSITNEAVNHGYKPIMGDFQNQFRAMVGYPVSQIDLTGHCIVKNLDEIKDADIGTYELLKARKVRSFYCHKITNDDGYVVGALCILYNNNNKTQENPNHIDQYISHMADQISGVLKIEKEDQNGNI